MKRETALRYAHEIARRVRSVNGLLATPLCNAEAVRFKRIWVFGSTVKGSAAPNDLDVLIELAYAGRGRSWQQTKVNKDYLRRYGVRLAPSADDEALKWLTRGMRNVSRHTTLTDEVQPDVKVLIYPRNDLADASSAPLAACASPARRARSAKAAASPLA
jgi:predicted nucleotidyltransferase